jgi:hypothetical protein
MNIWETRSNNRQQVVISGICLVAGIVLTVALRDYGASGSNRQAGFLLGVVLLGLGIATLFAGSSQTVQVDVEKREIRILDQRIVGNQHHTVAFDQVQRVEVACLQTRSQHALRYFLQLQLVNGETYPLFSPEKAYPRASDAAVVASWKHRLDTMLAARMPAAAQPPAT